METWKPIPIPELVGLYEVSDLGRIKSLSREVIRAGRGFLKAEKILCLTKNNHGYYGTILGNGKGGKFNIKIHRLIAIAFIPNPENLQEVNHKFGDKSDNRACALEWVDRSGNIKHAYKHRLRVSYMAGVMNERNHLSKSVIQMDMEGNEIKVWPSISEVVRVGLASSSTHVSKCCNGKQNSVRGFKYKYT